MKRREKEKEIKERNRKCRSYQITLGKSVTSVKSLLSHTFMEEKCFWIELKESNDIFQRVSFRTPIFFILSTSI